MESKVEDVDDLAIWPAAVEIYFITLLRKEFEKGFYISSIDKQTWNSMENDMFAKYGRRYTVARLRTKFNRMKKMHCEFSNLLAQPGVRWDSRTNFVHAADEVWEAYLKKNPSAKRFRKKGCNHYDMLTEIFGKTSSTDHLHSQSSFEDEQQLDGLETGAHVEPDAGIEETTDYESGISAIALRRRAISPLEKAQPTKQARRSKHLRLDNELGAWTKDLSYKVEASLGRTDQLDKKNEILSSGFDPYSVAECMDKLESIANVENVSYFKAMERFVIPEWRQMFIKMSEVRRHQWLESLKN